MKQSEYIQGTEGNYHWPVRFELNGGYLRLEQSHTEPRLESEPSIEVVLLSQKQVKELLKFLDAERRLPAKKVRVNSFN
ncbi:hypothetical protein LCGC14_0294860 [marine sediment metagenome]|uniref:Uncharacterized protein n=1 Tax=marine sediment metagenome TaxID=412755 RepID=A0A0F9WXV3_9ZZZZ